MLVLKTIAAFALLMALYIFFTRWYARLEQKYKYNFFNESLFITAAVSNCLIFFGQQWYFQGVKDNGDLLNGGLLILFGVLGILYIIYRNVKGTNFFIGVLGSIVQLSLFVMGTGFAIFAIVGFFVAVSEAKPTYVINND